MRQRSKAVLSVVAGVVGLAFASWIEIPMIPVPITLQTYVVLLIGVFLGWRRGLVTIGIYLGCAALGLPVLAGGASGLARLTGPTGGYLFGFALAVVVVGLMARRGWAGASLWRSLVTMVSGQALTVVCGASWLAAQRDWPTAWESGVRPFLIGALIKSFLAAWTVWLVARIRSASDPPPSGGRARPR